MREIKFRAWNKRDKVMEYDVNVNQGKPVKQGCQWFNTENTETVYHSALQQYTGLKDQNGRDIYENDIVRFIDGLGIVKYEEALASFYITYPFAGDWWNITIPDLFTDKDSQWLEVIGNTFENPELLEESK